MVKALGTLVGSAAVIAWFILMVNVGMDMNTDTEQGIGVPLQGQDRYNGALPPCPTEDSVSCYWDATEHGDGEGRSFTADALGNVTFWDDMDV